MPGFEGGCAVNVGGVLGSAAAYRHCLQLDATGRGNMVQLAYSITVVGGKSTMQGALLGTDYAAWNGQGWMALGFQCG